jgi:hypothetical protein
MIFISTDEEEWWRQMQHVGWSSLLNKIGADDLQRIKEAIFKDLQPYKRTVGIHFKKIGSLGIAVTPARYGGGGGNQE